MSSKAKCTKKQEAFIHTVQTFYREEGRHYLPWRKTKDPYRILLSEVMLQQTQVDRVIPKYTAFLKQFPTVKALATAELADVLRAWQGLGYNRRGKFLHQCAQAVLREHQGRLPNAEAELRALPGIGAYTASAVCAFAYNKPVVLIETNVRSVFLHHFLKGKDLVSDREILPLIERTLLETDVRSWYYALMDYGSYIKKTYGNPNHRSLHYTKQSPFKGSTREIRGEILSLLLIRPYTRKELHQALSPREDIVIDAQMVQLEKEELIEEHNGKYLVPRMT